MLEAKRCPFCKGYPSLYIVDIGVLSVNYFVACKQCGCRTKNFYTKEVAVKSWNRREDYDYIYEKDLKKGEQ